MQAFIKNSKTSFKTLSKRCAITSDWCIVLNCSVDQMYDRCLQCFDSNDLFSFIPREVWTDKRVEDNHYCKLLACIWPLVLLN